MNGRCVICGKRFHSNRSRTYCARHYWRLRRLGEKAEWELQRIAEEADHTKQIIAIVLDKQRTEDDVADLQRNDGLYVKREG